MVVTLETERVLVIRRSRSVRAWCRECAREADMVTPSDVEIITGVPQASFAEHGPAQYWHVVEGEDGVPLICLQSLLDSM